MMRIVLTLVFFTFSLGLIAQDDGERKGRPDVPGILQVEYGVQFSADVSVPFKTFGSRTWNIYYLQDYRLGDSKISFHPGIGVGLDKYKFDLDSLNRDITIIDTPDSSYYAPIAGGLNVQRSFLMSNYLEIPIEFRYNSNPDDPSRSFSIAFGAKVGVLLQGKSKYAYKVGTETHKIKQQHPFQLSRVRYGAYLRVGGGGFNVFVNYMISPIYKEGKGHLGEDPHMISTGISFNLF